MKTNLKRQFEDWVHLRLSVSKSVLTAADPSEVAVGGTGLSHGRLRRGQAFIEFALIVTLVAVLAFASIDLGMHISLASDVANAARAGALVLTPSNIVGNIDQRPEGAFRDMLYAMANDLDFANTVLAQEGQITVSFLRRNPAAQSEPGGSNDLLRIERQYHRGPGGNPAPKWPSRFGSGPSEDPGNSYEYTMIPRDRINSEVISFNSGDWVVLVEIFYPPVIRTPLRNLLSNQDTTDPANRVGIYEYAMF